MPSPTTYSAVSSASTSSINDGNDVTTTQDGENPNINEDTVGSAQQPANDQAKTDVIL